jgi:hypothetical protein
MDDTPKGLKKELDKFKTTSKKLTVPKGLLEGANSYDEKLMVVKVVADKDHKKVVRLIKDMLKSDKE